MAARTIQTREIATGISNLISALDYSLGMREHEARRQGYYSSQDAAAAMGLGINHAQRKLKAACLAGLVERTKVILDIGGLAYYYRPLKQSGKKTVNCKGRK